MNVYRFTEPFRTEAGAVIEPLEIAYHTFGTLNAAKDNVVWVCHALTANSDVADWWPGTVEEGKFLDPARWFVVCANIPGSCYGSTGPLSINPATGAPYYGDFPPLTMRDIARVLHQLATAIGVGRINTLVGSSVGGFQALEWAAAHPERFDRLVELVQASAYEQNQKELGTVVPVLVEGASKRDERMLSGKSPKNQTVHAPLPEGLAIEELVGTFVDVKVEEAKTWYLRGSLVR